MIRLRTDESGHVPEGDEINAVRQRDIGGHDRQPRIEPGEPLEVDRVELASIESFPCSDAPGYGSCHA